MFDIFNLFDPANLPHGLSEEHRQIAETVGGLLRALESVDPNLRADLIKLADQMDRAFNHPDIARHHEAIQALLPRVLPADSGSPVSGN